MANFSTKRKFNQKEDLTIQSLDCFYNLLYIFFFRLTNLKRKKDNKTFHTCPPRACSSTISKLLHVTFSKIRRFLSYSARNTKISSFKNISSSLNYLWIHQSVYYKPIKYNLWRFFSKTNAVFQIANFKLHSKEVRFQNVWKYIKND